MEDNVILVVRDPIEMSFLEYLLQKERIPYDMELSHGKYGIEPPHLIVNGVPLDEERSFKWVIEKGDSE